METEMFEHIALYYDLRVHVYTEAAEFAAMAHVADYMLERWWQVFAESHADSQADEFVANANGYTFA